VVELLHHKGVDAEAAQSVPAASGKS